MKNADYKYKFSARFTKVASCNNNKNKNININIKKIIFCLNFLIFKLSDHFDKHGYTLYHI